MSIKLGGFLFTTLSVYCPLSTVHCPLLSLTSPSVIHQVLHNMLSCFVWWNPHSCTLNDQGVKSDRNSHYKIHHWNRVADIKEQKNKRSRWNNIELEQNHSPYPMTTDNFFNKVNRKIKAASHVYVNAQIGNESSIGTSSDSAVRFLSFALTIVQNQPRPLADDLIVHQSGTFERERLLVLDENHAGSSASAKVIFRRDTGGTPTRLLGGNVLSIVRFSDLTCTIYSPCLATCWLCLSSNQ